MCFMVSLMLSRLRTGYVTRLVLEDGLRQHCRHALHSLSAPALLDLMDAHAAGVLAAMVSSTHCCCLIFWNDEAQLHVLRSCLL